MSVEPQTLLTQAIAGNEDSLCKLLLEFGPSIRPRINHRIPGKWRSIIDADDVLQQTYVDAFHNIRSLKNQGIESFIKWLNTLANRNLIDAIRVFSAEKRGGRHNSIVSTKPLDSIDGLLESVLAASNTPSRIACDRELNQQLAAAIDKLPNDYRLVIEEYDLKGNSVQVLAVKLGRSTGAIFMIRSRAHRMLAELVGLTSSAA